MIPTRKARRTAMAKHKISFDNPRAQMILRRANEPSAKEGRIGLYIERKLGKFELLEVVPVGTHHGRKKELETEHNRQIIASYGTPGRLSP
jgi:hypothetical protein